ncbi:MAG: FtsX-like permease family protein [Methylobacillus sp.]|jgi:putative ABC transport system permease protein|nr:FtsX-like permease family protein [Methylobacillus sp.]
MIAWQLARQQLLSSWRSGEVRVLLFALVLAVAAMTSVGFFADRIQNALARQGGQLLGGDLAVISDQPLPASYSEKARELNLRIATTLEFPSMAMHGEQSQLADIKAVSATYPLLGQMKISDQPYGAERIAEGVPQAGEVWIEPRLAGMLDLKIGDMLMLGERELRVASILQQDPARGGNMFNIAPRLMMNADDVASTNLVQYGSRVRYRLLLAGEPDALTRYRDAVKPMLQRGTRIEDVQDARPEIRSALDKARQFLGLASMASVILSMVAMSLAALRFARRHLDTCALMRCFGASQSLILRVFLLQALMLGLLGSVVGSAIGYSGQEVLARLAGSLFLEQLPLPGWVPAMSGLLAGMATMLGVMLPHLLRLRDVPALRILRRDLGEQSAVSWLAWMPGVIVMLALVFLSARDAKLGGIVLGGLAALALVAGMVALGLGRVLRRVSAAAGGVWRIGMASVLRRPGASIAQVAGFSLGLMAMALLTLVRGDLMHNWQSTLPPDAPNRFVINILPEQIPSIRDFFRKENLAVPEIFPMIRGRLVEINGKPLDTSRYVDARARRLAEREFNLSIADVMQQDNKIVEGRWWRDDERGQPLLSLEEGIAKTLELHLGDRLTYDIAGERITLTIQSLRKVEWDTMRANFFAVTPPGVLEKHPSSSIMSFHLAAGREDVLNRLVRNFSNLTVVDIEAVLSQVRAIMDRMALAIQFVFAFCMLAGLAVLYAALAATRDERTDEVALLRVFGASRQQVRAAILAEFAGIGLLAGIVAAIGAEATASLVSLQVLHIPYSFSPLVGLATICGGLLLVPLAAWLGLRRIVDTPPRQVLLSV